jgi:hypothetical protein
MAQSENCKPPAPRVRPDIARLREDLAQLCHRAACACDATEALRETYRFAIEQSRARLSAARAAVID